MNFYDLGYMTSLNKNCFKSMSPNKEYVWHTRVCMDTLEYHTLCVVLNWLLLALGAAF